jgi:cell division protein FtsB
MLEFLKHDHIISFILTIVALYNWISYKTKYSNEKYDHDCLKEAFDELQKENDSLRQTNEDLKQRIHL